jgi:4,5:9,10-diseco-3-hydroxy-5,9,17-trioxoandrosta-1(10),2-diene-4-oate hydrolase
MDGSADKFIKVGSIKSRYLTSGTAGKEVILVHGLGSFAESWQNNIEALSEDFKVYALDLAGFGKSDKPKASYTYDYFATFLHDFMQAMNVKSASLMGHSLGGGTVLQYALKYPDSVDKLVIIGSAGLGQEANAIVKVISIPFIGELLTRPSRKGAVKLLKELVYDGSVITDDIVELWYQMSIMPRAQKAFLKTNRAVTNVRGYRKKEIEPIKMNLDKIEAPTLILWGDHDNMVPLSHAEFAKQHISNATMHVFTNCGHCPMLEYASEFNAVVKKFLSNAH